MLVNVGLQAIAQGAAWTLLQNYNASLGNPFSSAWGNLGNLYGAVGASSVAVAASQTALGGELGRVNLSNGSIVGTGITLDFFYGTGQGNGSIFEAGIFVQAGLTQTMLTSALVFNTNYSSLSVAALPATIPSGVPIVISYGSISTQTVTTTAQANAGATSISVSTFAANNGYPSGTAVAYTPGSLLDRVVFPTAQTKTNTQVATLELNLTMTSA